MHSYNYGFAVSDFLQELFAWILYVFTVFNLSAYMCFFMEVFHIIINVPKMPPNYDSNISRKIEKMPLYLEFLNNLEDIKCCQNTLIKKNL